MAQVERIQESFRQNDQMYLYHYTRRDLPGVLYSLTGKKYRIEKRNLLEDAPQIEASDGIPF